MFFFLDLSWHWCQYSHFLRHLMIFCVLYFSSTTSTGIVQLNIIYAIHFITGAKSKIYWQGVKSVAIATVIKCIAHTKFNHIKYNIFDFLLVPAKIKYTWAAPSYILFIAGTSKKSKMLYIILS